MKGLILTYLLAYGGIPVALLNPFLGMSIYIALAILMPESLWPWSVPQQGNFSRWIALATLVGWAVRGLGTWRFGRGKAVVVMILGFLVWSILSAVNAPIQSVAWEFVNKISKIIVTVLVGVTTIDSPRRVRQVLWLIFLCEGYVALEFNLSYFSGYNRLRLDGFGGMDNNCNAIALVTCLGLSLNAGLSEEGRFRKLLALFVSALMAHAILFSFSRGGMLAMGVTGLLTFILMPKQPKHFLVILLAIVVIIRLAGPEVVERFTKTLPGENGQLEESADSRLRLWADCWDVMKKNPILGAGPEHWPLLASSYGWPDRKEAHSLWVQAAAELGFPGAGFLVLYYLICIGRLWPLARGKQAGGRAGLTNESRMVVVSLIGFATAAQFVSLRFLEPPYYVAMVGVAILKLSSLAADCEHPEDEDFSYEVGAASPHYLEVRTETLWRAP